MEIKSLKDKKMCRDEFLRILLYGPAGAGKTTLAASFPKPFLFNFDDKLKSIYGLDVDYVDYSSLNPKEMDKNWQRFWKDFSKMKSDTEYSTFIFDGLTIMDRMLLARCNVLAGKGAGDKATLPVYGEQATTYKHLFMEMNAIKNKNIILTGHHLEVRDDGAGKDGHLLEITPLITGKKIRPILPAMFEEVYYLERIGGEKDLRRMHYRPYKKANANSTILRGKEGKLDNPTYETIIEQAIKES